jgi:hypothetical protein
MLAKQHLVGASSELFAFSEFSTVAEGNGLVFQFWASS